MNSVVIDASAGVELAADTLLGRALRTLLPAESVPWVPELFFVECGAVLRRWDLNRILTPAQIDQAIDALMGWPLRVTQVRVVRRRVAVTGKRHLRRRGVRGARRAPWRRPAF